MASPETAAHRFATGLLAFALTANAMNASVVRTRIALMGRSAWTECAYRAANLVNAVLMAIAPLAAFVLEDLAETRNAAPTTPARLARFALMADASQTQIRLLAVAQVFFAEQTETADLGAFAFPGSATLRTRPFTAATRVLLLTQARRRRHAARLVLASTAMESLLQT